MVRRDSPALVLEATRSAMVAGVEVNIADVVEQSGVSVGSVYHHFANKQGLMAAVRQEAEEHFAAALRGALVAALSKKRNGSIRRGKRGRRLFVQSSADFYGAYVLEFGPRAAVLDPVSLVGRLATVLGDVLPHDAKDARGFCALLFGGLFCAGPDPESRALVVQALVD